MTTWSGKKDKEEYFILCNYVPGPFEIKLEKQKIKY
jgi:hypothetical protein